MVDNIANKDCSLTDSILEILQKMREYEDRQINKIITPYRQSKHANNKYCISVVEALIKETFGVQNKKLK